MSSAPLLPAEALFVARNRWDGVVELLLGVLLVFMPLAFGAVDAWSEMIALGLAAALTLVVTIRVAADRSFSLSWTWAYAPLALFVGLILLQLAPLPHKWTAALSPASVATRDELLDDEFTPIASAGLVPVTMYPLATTHMLRVVLIGVAVFFTVVSAFPTPQHLKRLLLIVFAIGCAEGTVALLQIVTGADQLYWTMDAGSARLTSGSFINYSHFAQFMNLSIGAGLSLVLVKLHEDSQPAELSAGYGRPDGFRSPRLELGGVSLGDHGALFVGIILSAVAILASLSRNGAISLGVAGLVVGTSLFARGTLSGRGWVLAALPLGALAVLLLFGFDVVYERMATLQDREQLASRWELTRGVLRAWQAYPWLGAGLGTHEFVFPMYDTAVSGTIAGHADNDYAQLLEETGVVGAAAVAAFLAIIVGALIALCRRGATPLSTAAFGLVFGLVAVAIHSASDFGQHIPAVFCLTAVYCGIAIQLRRIERAATAAEFHAPPLAAASSRIAAGVLALGLALAWAWVLQGAYAAHVGEQWWVASLLVEDEIRAAGPDATDADYADLLVAAQHAATAQPGSVEYAYMLNLDRWQSMARVVDPATGQMRLTRSELPLIERIADELAAARPLCPTYGPPYALEGQLRLFVLQQAAGRDLIRKGVRLAAYDAPTCLIAGQLAAREGDAAEADRLLTRAVALDEGFFADAAASYLDELDRPDLAQALAGSDYDRLVRLADVAGAGGSRAEFVGELNRQAEAVLRARATAQSVTAPELASLAGLDASRGDARAAADAYARALKLDYNRIDWRLARARALLTLDENEQALREVRICLQLNPAHAGALQLLEELE